MKKNRNLLLLFLLILCLSFVTIGFALYEQPLKLNGDISLKKPGTIEITKIEEYSSDLPTNSGSLKLVNGKIELDYSFSMSQDEANYTATYLITIKNNSPYDYNFSGFNLEPSITVSGTTTDKAGAILTYEYANLNLTDQVLVGGVIPSTETKKVAITIHFEVKSEVNNAHIGVGGSAGVNTSTDNSGTFYAGIVNSPITLDLTSNNTLKRDCFNVSVTNTYKNEVSYTFSLINNNFNLVDNAGDTLGSFTIAAPSEENGENVQQVEVCVAIKEGSQFAVDTEKSNLIIVPSGIQNFSIGSLTMKVDKDETLTYEGKPELTDLSFSALKYVPATETEEAYLSTSATWSRKDTDGLSMDFWTIELYGETSTGSTLIQTFEVDGGEDTTIYELKLSETLLTSQAFTNIINNNGNFFIRVYGTDTAGNTGSGDCSSSEEQFYCVSSASTSLKYKFTLTATSSNTSVNISLTNTTNNTATVYLNNPFTSVISLTTSGYSLNGITVTKGEDPLKSGEGYTYSQQADSSTKADFSIPKDIIDDNITISVASYYSDWSCLIKGTKIKVHNGYKNIEDIKYDDLLEVYSYELGRVVYEYPIKIEQEGKTDFYQQITFSDGSILNTFSEHGIFSKDLNKFVSVLDRENFHVGTTVLKIENGNLKEVKVIKTENIYNDTTYYHVASTRYLNIIANDFLTTDPILPISNIFSFNNDLTWGSDREKYLKENDLISYELLKNYFPKYLYEGIRMGEAKHLINNGIISIEDYVTKFSKMSFIPIPTDTHGNNKWMVTTSIDLENGSKGEYYTEGSIYMLPNMKSYYDKKFVCWYNTSDGKCYQTGDLVEVKHGMYFEAIYEENKMFSMPSF